VETQGPPVDAANARSDHDGQIVFVMQGLLRRTSTELMDFDLVDKATPRLKVLMFAVNMWHPAGLEPQNFFDVVARFMDIQFFSRMPPELGRQLETQRQRHIILELAKRLPPAIRGEAPIREMIGWGCARTMHIKQLLAPRLDDEDHLKEMDFSPAGIFGRWDAGRVDTGRFCRARRGLVNSLRWKASSCISVKCFTRLLTSRKCIFRFI
jgi:Patatin phospholipase